MPLRNVHACLVHEECACVLDLVKNLHRLDPESAILLYNGGPDRDLLGGGFAFESYGAVVHPAPRRMRWGRLHEFALDCMRFAHAALPFDTMTIVDSDQLAARSGYSGYLERFLASHPGVGLIGSPPRLRESLPRAATPAAPPAIAARRELPLWRPFLRRFRHGEASFVHWTFWPSTVFTAAAARDLVALFEDSQLRAILRRSRMWATEEVLFPTLAALAGHGIAENPCSYEYVRHRASYSNAQMDAALADPSVYWLHPIPRRYDDPLRRCVRAHFDHYGEADPPREEPASRETEPPRVTSSGPAYRPPAAVAVAAEPLVSAIMPTANRRRFVPRAIRYFLRQDYPHCELLVVDDGRETVADLIPEDPRIRYVRLPDRKQVGWKRNYACREARGEIIVHWDDDDWMASRRLRYQVTRLLETRAAICGLARILYYEPAQRRSWQFVYAGGGRPWLLGATLCYRKSFWEKNPFRNVDVGEDALFLWGARPKPRIAPIHDPTFFVGIVHPDNVSPKQVGRPPWLPLPVDRIRDAVGDDFDDLAEVRDAGSEGAHFGPRLTQRREMP
jgi:hypothetical protein